MHGRERSFVELVCKKVGTALSADWMRPSRLSLTLAQAMRPSQRIGGSFIEEM
jgi:hypothetical protein